MLNEKREDISNFESESKCAQSLATVARKFCDEKDIRVVTADS